MQPLRFKAALKPHTFNVADLLSGCFKSKQSYYKEAYTNKGRVSSHFLYNSDRFIINQVYGFRKSLIVIGLLSMQTSFNDNVLRL